MLLESILSSYILHTVEEERLCYCSHKLFMDVSLQNMQSCFPVYQVLLQPRVIQIKACRTSRLQILPPVRFPRSTVIMPVPGFQQTPNSEVAAALPSVSDGYEKSLQQPAGSCWPGEWCSDSQALQHSHSVWPVSLSTITCGTDLSSPFSSFISAQHSLITWLLGMFQTKPVQHGAKPGVAGAEQMQTVHWAVISLEGSFKRLHCGEQDLLLPFLQTTKPKHKE